MGAPALPSFEPVPKDRETIDDVIRWLLDNEVVSEGKNASVEFEVKHLKDFSVDELLLVKGVAVAQFETSESRTGRKWRHLW